MRSSFDNLLLIATVFSVVLVGCSNDSSDGEDDVLRLINSLSVQGLQVTYDYPEGGRTVTLTATGGPGPETLEFVSFNEDDQFSFSATWQDRQGRANCIVGKTAVTNGAADVVIFPTQDFDTGEDIIEIDCASNWKNR